MSTTRSTASVRPAGPAEVEAGAACPARPGGERGTAIVGTLVGFLIFMTLLLFSVQFLVRLYATSTLTAAAESAAAQVADSPDPVTAAPQAEAEARQQLGPFGATHASFHWVEVDDQQVVLEVNADSPSFLPLPAAWRSITRTVTVRTELFR
jgi:hypothetical protein